MKSGVKEYYDNGELARAVLRISNPNVCLGDQSLPEYRANEILDILGLPPSFTSPEMHGFRYIHVVSYSYNDGSGPAPYHYKIKAL